MLRMSRRTRALMSVYRVSFCSMRLLTPRLAGCERIGRGEIDVPVPRVVLPNPVTLHTAESFVNQTAFPWPPVGGSAELVLPKGYCYLAPMGIAAIAAWGDTLRGQHVQITCENVDTRGVGYASRLHMFDFLGCQGPAMVEHEETGRFIPVTRIQNQKQLRDFAINIVPLLHVDSPETVSAVRYCFEELVRNVLEHAGGPAAYACAQYYPASSKVSIAVADCGQGLLGSLSGNHPELSDDEAAVLLALRPGVSGVTARRFGGQENAGAGLFFTKSIAKFSGERFLLYSGRGGYLLFQHRDDAQRAMVFEEPECDKHKLLSGSCWPGTIVALDIGVSPTYSFGHVLKTIRDRYYDFTKGSRVHKAIRFEKRGRR